MKISSISILFFLLLAFGQQASAQGKFDSWPELKNFHKVMAQTFHPMEEGNLQPIRTRSGEMYDQASILKKSKIPAEFDRKEVRDAIAELKKGSKALHKQIKKGASDDTVKTSLTALHDTFHKIVGLCNREDEDKH